MTTINFQQPRKCACGKEISAARLKALPATRVCLACREKADEHPLTARSLRMRGAMVEMSAFTSHQERAVETLEENRR